MNYKYFCLLLSTFLLLCSCTENKKVENVTENGLPVFEFNSQDSLEVRQLVDQYVSFFSQNDYDSMADMLYVVHMDSVIPLSGNDREGFMKAISILPNFGCEVKDIELVSDHDNRVRIALKVTEDGDLAKEKGTINFFLNPVLSDGKWYLSLLDENAVGVGLYH